MKRVLFSLSAILTLIAVSCNKENPVSYEECSSRTLKVTTAIDNSTKIYLDDESGTPTLFWGKGEYLQLYYFDTADKFCKSSDTSADANDGQKTGAFSFSVTPETADEYKLGAIYPASSVQGPYNTDPAAYKVSLPSVQKSTADNFDPSAFIMVSKSETFSEFPAEWTASFKRAVSLNIFTLKGVKENVNGVQISISGKNLAGSRNFNLTDGTAADVTSSISDINIQYATALSAGDVDVYFTSWGANVSAGENIEIKVIGAENTYTKVITAGSKGIAMSEGKLCKLSVDFSSVDADADPTVWDFIQSYAGELEVWENTIGSVEPYSGAGYYRNGHIIPQDYTFYVGTVKYTKAQALWLACKIYTDFVEGTKAISEISLSDYTIPSPCKWGAYPYTEQEAKQFQNVLVYTDLLTNLKGRSITYFGNHSNQFANVSGASGHSSLGYTGDVCLERLNLCMARLFKYVVDNNIVSGAGAALKSVPFKSDLYTITPAVVTPSSLVFDYKAGSGTLNVNADAEWSLECEEDWVTISPASGSAVELQNVTVNVTANPAGTTRNATITLKSGGSSIMTVSVTQNGVPSELYIKDFAEEFVEVIDVWNESLCTMNFTAQDQTIDPEGKYHFIPESTTITVGTNVYSTADMFEIALRSYILLRGYDGNNTSEVGADTFPDLSGSTMSGTKIPTTHSYYWNTAPYSEPSNGGLLNGVNAAKVKVDVLDNFSQRAVNFKSGKPISNSCGYTKSQLAGYTGCFCSKRALITMARFFKYMLDNELETATGIDSSTEFDGTFY